MIKYNVYLYKTTYTQEPWRNLFPSSPISSIADSLQVDQRSRNGPEELALFLFSTRFPVFISPWAVTCHPVPYGELLGFSSITTTPFLLGPLVYQTVQQNLLNSHCRWRMSRHTRQNACLVGKEDAGKWCIQIQPTGAAVFSPSCTRWVLIWGSYGSGDGSWSFYVFMCGHL